MIHRAAAKSPLANRHCHGVALLLVMVAVAMTATLAVTFLSRQRATTGVGHNIAHQPRARAAAETGLDAAITYIKQNTNWRSDGGHTHGQWTQFTSFAGGRFKVKFEDPEDGKLKGDSSDPVVITAHGNNGDVSHRVRARVEMTGGESGKELVLIVRNGSNLDQYDRARKSQFEAWGYNVTVLDDNASKQQYQQTTGNTDVVYISERVNSGSVERHGVIRDLSQGVVSEEGYNNDALGLSPNHGPGTYGRSIDVVDGTHYITKPFGRREVKLTRQYQQLREHPGPIASGAHRLAEKDWGSKLTLAVFDKGDATHHGRAKGKRVFMPWGDGGFRINGLTGDGKTLLKRALEWAGGGSDQKSFGIAASGTIELTGSKTKIDSFQSSAGQYEADTAGQSARVATSATRDNSIKLTGQAKLAGDAFVGPGADLAKAIRARDRALTGSKNHLSQPLNIQLPAPGFHGRRVHRRIPDSGTVNFGLPVLTRNIRMSNLELKGDVTMRVNGPVNAIIDGDVEISDDASIEIASGASLKLYVNGKFKASDRASINTTNANPGDFRVYMMNGGQIELAGSKDNAGNGNGRGNGRRRGNGGRGGRGFGRGNSLRLRIGGGPPFGNGRGRGPGNRGNGQSNGGDTVEVYGMLIGPEAQAKIEDNAHLYGLFHGKSLKMTGGGQLHQDLDTRPRNAAGGSAKGSGSRRVEVTWLEN